MSCLVTDEPRQGANTKSGMYLLMEIESVPNPFTPHRDAIEGQGKCSGGTADIFVEQMGNELADVRTFFPLSSHRPSQCFWKSSENGSIIRSA